MYMYINFGRLALKIQTVVLTVIVCLNRNPFRMNAGPVEVYQARIGCIYPSFLQPLTFFRPKEEAASSSGAGKKGKNKHPSSVIHTLFDSSGEGEDEDDLFSSLQTTGAAATKRTGKVKPVTNKDMDALFDEIDLGTYVHVCICMCVQVLVDGKYMYVLEN